MPSRRFSIAASNVRYVLTGSTNSHRAQAYLDPRPAASALRRGLYSTVTVFARFRGWSTFMPRSRAMR